MIRNPYQNLYTKNVTSTLTGSDTFTLPYQDFDSVVVKMIVASLGSGALNVFRAYIQTTDDGGTTWYDNVAFGTISTTIASAAALFAIIPVNVGSAAYIGNITNSALGGYVGGISNLPILSRTLRLVWNYGSMTDTAQANWTVTISANNQSPRT